MIFKPHVTRGTLTLGLVIALLLSTLGSVRAGSQIEPAAPTVHDRGGSRTAGSGLPCELTASRTVDNQIVAEGDAVTVSANYRYRCERDDPRVNFFLVVENTPALRGSGASRQLLANTKSALIHFVNRVDFDNGSQGGLTVYAKDYSNRVTLQGGRNGRLALLHGLRILSSQAIDNAAGAPSAIRDTTERLPTGDTNARNVLVVIDAGAPVTTKPLIDFDTACGAAKQAGVTVAVIGLAEAGGRGGGCATKGWSRVSASPSGDDLIDIVDHLADGLLKGAEPNADELYDRLSPGLEYVPGSGRPSEPDYTFGRELGWSFVAEQSATDRTIEYKVRAVSESGNIVVPLSVGASAALYFGDSGRVSVDLDKPNICIHRPGQIAFCEEYFSRLTPTPNATSTMPVPTAEPTREPTVVTTPIPTETSVAARAYLPALRCNK